jgi:hypothetical protein
MKTTRASSKPQNPSLLSRLFGVTAASPVLPVGASKFGGQPYLEKADDWPMSGFKRLSYLGQINFGELTGHVPDAPRQGILVFYLGLSLREGWTSEVRWYPNPDPDKAVQVHPESSIAKYEAAIEFIPSWDFSCSEAWQEVLGDKDGAVWDEVLEWHDEFWKALGYDDGTHVLFPQASYMLHEELAVPEVIDVKTVAKFSGDSAARFDWGTNWLYYLIKDDDLRAGRLDRTFFRLLNA